MFRKLIFFPVLFCFSLGMVMAQDGYWLSYKIEGELSLRDIIQFKDSLDREMYVKSLYSNLYQRGFLGFSVTKYHNADTLKVDLVTGEVFKWLSLDISQLGEVLPGGIGKVVKHQSSQVISVESFSQLQLSIITEAENNGFPFAQVKLDSLIRERNELSAKISIELGPKIIFDTLKILGNSKVKPIYLHRLLDIKVGSAFSQKKVTDAVAILRNLPYARLVGAPEISFQNSEATIYFPLQDRNLNSLDGIIGVLPNELEGNRLLITGQFDLKLFNIGGKGRDFSVQWQRFNQLSQSLNLQAAESHLLGSKLNFNLGFSLLKEDTTFLNRAFNLGFMVNLSPESQLSFFSNRQASDLLASFGLSELRELPEVGDFRLNSYGLGHRFFRVDDRFSPKRGWKSDVSFSIGNKNIIQNTAIPQELYEDIELRSLQYQIQASLQHFWGICNRFTFFQNLSFGAIENANLFLNDLFRLGGLQTFRGFNENFFFASDYIYLNLEPRFYFDRYSYFMIFADVGRFGNQVQSSPIEFPYAAGLGFSLETQSGFFNFVYALGGSNTQDFAFNQSKIHFGYTGRF